MATLRDLGFVPEHTGGNCWALVLRTGIPAPLGDRWIIWVTDGNFGIDLDDLCDGCRVEVGWYADEDAVYEGRACETADFATEDEAARAIGEWLARHGQGRTT